MPFYILKIWPQGKQETLHEFDVAPLQEATAYTRAKAQLNVLRRASRPDDGYELRLIFADNERMAHARLKRATGRHFYEKF